MKIIIIVPKDIPLICIGYKYYSWGVLGFTDDKGGVIVDTGYHYLYQLFCNYFNVSIHPAINPNILGRCFNSCNVIYQHNNMCQYVLTLDKYWVTQSGYYRLVIKLEFVMSIKLFKSNIIS